MTITPMAQSLESIVEPEPGAKPRTARSDATYAIPAHGQRSFWKLAVELPRHDVHSRLEFAIDGMKVRWSVITVVHSDYDTKKSTKFWHSANYSADARRFRLALWLKEVCRQQM